MIPNQRRTRNPVFDLYIMAVRVVPGQQEGFELESTLCVKGSGRGGSVERSFRESNMK